MIILYRFPSKSFTVLILTFRPTLRLLFLKQKTVLVCFIHCGQRALAAADVSLSSFLPWAGVRSGGRESKSVQTLRLFE